MRPVNISKSIGGVIGLASPIYQLAATLAQQSNVRLGEVLQLINRGQQVANSLLPLLPSADFDLLTPEGTPLPNHGITRQDWDDQAVASWGSVPPGGVIPNIMAVFAASRAFSTAYTAELLPTVQPLLLGVDPATGLILTRPEQIVLMTDQVDLVRAEAAALRDALEPISEL